MGNLCRVFVALACAWLAIHPGGAVAQAGGSAKPQRIVVPFGPGSVGDVTGRLISDSLSKRTGVPVIVDSRVGAGSLIAMQLVSKAEPDGSTFLLNSNAATILQVVSAAAAAADFDVRRDLEPVTHAFQGTQGILVHPSLPVKSVAEFIAHAKQRPGAMNYGSSGVGSAVHMNTELFKMTAGIDLVQIPFNGGVPQLNALAANDVQLLVFDTALAKPYIEGGRIKLLAVTTPQRSPAYPNIPTVSESGLPGFEAAFWYGIFTTPRTPKATLDKLNADINAVLQEASVREKLQQLGYMPVASTPDQLRRKVVDEVDAWNRVARAAKLEKQ